MKQAGIKSPYTLRFYIMLIKTLTIELFKQIVSKSSVKRTSSDRAPLGVTEPKTEYHTSNNKLYYYQKVPNFKRILFRSLCSPNPNIVTFMTFPTYRLSCTRENYLHTQTQLKTQCVWWLTVYFFVLSPKNKNLVKKDITVFYFILLIHCQPALLLCHEKKFSYESSSVPRHRLSGQLRTCLACGLEIKLSLTWY